MKLIKRCSICLVALALSSGYATAARLSFLNHNRPIVDAHNCYPYDGRWNNRIKRALNSGFPVSIEQDLGWYVDPATGKGRVVLSHTKHTTKNEPALRDYFFRQIRPIVEKALAENKRHQWPLIILHFDFKDTRPAILRSVWHLLGGYKRWLSTAIKTNDSEHLSPIDRKPILVLTEDSNAQAKIFFKDVPVGDRLRLFGSAHSHHMPIGTTKAHRVHWEATAPPDQLLTERVSNYRRWWNNPWGVVEEGGQTNAGAWTVADNRRLRALVDYAHRQGFWIRFYTLDGFNQAQNKGWLGNYNFGSMKQVIPRWKAAVAAGVNFIATDQYERLAHYVEQSSLNLRPSESINSAINVVALLHKLSFLTLDEYEMKAAKQQ